MRKIASLFAAVVLATFTGCGCLETWEDKNLTRYGGGGPDPDQPGWHQCLFGTRYLRGRGAPQFSPAEHKTL